MTVSCPRKQPYMTVSPLEGRRSGPRISAPEGLGLDRLPREGKRGQGLLTREKFSRKNVSEKPGAVHKPVVALNRQRFVQIENHSVELSIDYIPYSVPIATAVEKTSGHRYTFASAHVPGFSFSHIGDDEIGVRAGNSYCEALLEALRDFNGLGPVILGLDMNANPEILQGHSQRFEQFVSSGFTLWRSDEPTNVNPNEEPHQREIDFLMVADPKAQEGLAHFCFGDREFTAYGDIPSVFQSWNAPEMCSDHKPVTIGLIPTSL